MVAVFFFSCSNQSAIGKKLSGSDSLVIIFNVPNTDSVINILNTTEKKAIRKLSGFLNGTELKKDSCGFDGNMIFFNKGEILQTVIFQFSDKNCRYFLYDMPAGLNHSAGDHKVMNTSMSDEAEELLKSLAEGKAWY
jgi:hypothetical protein